MSADEKELFEKHQSINAFLGDGQLEIKLHTACAEDELAMDDGENMGSKWTSLFLDRGKEPKHNYKITSINEFS